MPARSSMVHGMTTRPFTATSVSQGHLSVSLSLFCSTHDPRLTLFLKIYSNHKMIHSSTHTLQQTYPSAYEHCPKMDERLVNYPRRQHQAFGDRVYAAKSGFKNRGNEISKSNQTVHRNGIGPTLSYAGLLHNIVEDRQMFEWMESNH